MWRQNKERVFTMEKIISLLMSIVLLFSVGAEAFAA